MRRRTTGIALLTLLFWVLNARHRRAVSRLAAAALESLLSAIDANDQDTGAHVRRVARYALIIGDELGLDPRQLRALERVALFHDIGKIHEALFDITHDRSTLTPDERRAIATHPRRGFDVLAPLAHFYPELAEGVLTHHERWDGTGYPLGLEGPRIPLLARIVAVADTFDVVATGRPYRRAGGLDAAARAVAAGRRSQFDPDIVDATLKPAVLARIAAAQAEARASHPPLRRPAVRTGKPRAGPAPDVAFRWRSTTRASLA